MLKNIIPVIVLLIVLTACDSDKKIVKAIAPPLVDGRIDDFIQLGIVPIKLSDDVDLYIFQNQHYTWLGYSYPEGSFGTLDLEIFSPKIKDTLNLHVSAQLGEWPLNNQLLIPDNPESDKWWNMDGWIANEVWINGMDKSGESPEYKFKNGKARELQLSKKRFGESTWYIKLNIRSIKGKDSEYYNIQFPSDSTFYRIEIN